MPADIDTEKIKRIVEERIDLHGAKCPAVQAFGDAVRTMEENQQKRHEAQLEEYHKTEMKMLEGRYRMKEHSRRIAATEDGVEANVGAIQTVAATINATKTSALLVIIKWLMLALLCGGFGAGATKLLGG